MIAERKINRRKTEYLRTVAKTDQQTTIRLNGEWLQRLKTSNWDQW